MQYYVKIYFEGGDKMVQGPMPKDAADALKKQVEAAGDWAEVYPASDVD